MYLQQLQEDMPAQHTKWTVTNNLMEETNSYLVDQEVLQKNHGCIDIFKQLVLENLKPIKGDK